MKKTLKLLMLECNYSDFIYYRDYIFKLKFQKTVRLCRRVNIFYYKSFVNKFLISNQSIEIFFYFYTKY